MKLSQYNFTIASTPPLAKLQAWSHVFKTVIDDLAVAFGHRMLAGRHFLAINRKRTFACAVWSSCMACEYICEGCEGLWRSWTLSPWLAYQADGVQLCYQQISTEKVQTMHCSVQTAHPSPKNQRQSSSDGCDQCGRWRTQAATVRIQQQIWRLAQADAALIDISAELSRERLHRTKGWHSFLVVLAVLNLLIDALLLDVKLSFVSGRVGLHAA